MAIVRLQDTELTDIGNSIRAKLGVATQYLPEEMAPAILTIPVIPPFEWGSETEAGAGTARWWADLKTWVGTASIQELAGCIGKTKSVTLTTPVLNITTHLVRCIGYNCNRDKNNPTRNTLTFETANTLSAYVFFGDSRWTNSAARQNCISYYNAFPGKKSIATVSIGTATELSATQTAPVVYTDETVFVASEAEHGFIPGYDPTYGKGHAASYDEFDKYNTSKTPYQYCTSDANRIKMFGDGGSKRSYWERSLHYNDATLVCCIWSNGRPRFATASTGGAFAPAFVI